MSAADHIARQARARKERLDMQDRLKVSGYVRQQVATVETTATTPVPRTAASSSSSSSSARPPAPPPPLPFTSLSSSNSSSLLADRHHDGDAEIKEGSGTPYAPLDPDLPPAHTLPIVELLEKERREWQAERLKLVHCIYLQQLELSQRAAAAHDRATDIAKDFARVIEGFEERLVAVETNVQTELLALKKIAEQIRTAVAPGAAGSRPMT